MKKIEKVNLDTIYGAKRYDWDGGYTICQWSEYTRRTFCEVFKYRFGWGELGYKIDEGIF